MNADEIDLCKENIQPLRQGRKTAQLGLALKAQNDREVHEQMLKERDSYELAITTYEGDDPLAPRYDYVKWIEQCCPKFGAESNMIPLLEDTIMLFKDDERYKQDQRFVDIILKYIETQDNVPELFQIVHSQGIGTTCASLYKSWAEYLDACQNLKGADQIYTLGIENNAQPIEMLREHQAQFQLSVARRMLLGGDLTPAVPAESRVTERQRTVLGKISKSSAAGSLRPAKHGAGSMNTLLSDSRNNVKINVYQEEENNEALLVGSQSNRPGSFVSSADVHKENLMKPQQWNKGFPKKTRTPAPPTVVLPVIPSTPTFKILRDEDAEDETDTKKSETSQPTPVTASKVLKTRKAEVAHKTPVQLFKSPHVDNVKNHMPKFEVFSGGKEFSFEELRLAYYNKRKEGNSLDEEDSKSSQRKLNLDYSVASTSQPDTPFSKTFSSRRPMLPLIEEDDF